MDSASSTGIGCSPASFELLFTHNEKRAACSQWLVGSADAMLPACSSRLAVLVQCWCSADFSTSPNAQFAPLPARAGFGLKIKPGLWIPCDEFGRIMNELVTGKMPVQAHFQLWMISRSRAAI